MEKMRDGYKILVGNSEWNRPLGRTRGRWEDIKVAVRQRGCEVD
jgi:hypothetical protein